MRIWRILIFGLGCVILMTELDKLEKSLQGTKVIISVPRPTPTQVFTR